MIGGSRPVQSSERAGNDAWSQKWLALEDLVFTEWRLRLYAYGMATTWVFCIAFVLTWQRNLIGPASTGACNDFSWMWVSGVFAGSPHPILVYDASAFSAARLRLTGSDCVFFDDHFVYPPTYLFFTWALGLMPYPAAWLAWAFATVAVYLAAIRAILPCRTAVVAALTPFVVVLNFLAAHNGFLTAGLIGLAFAAGERRPFLSGSLLGLLTFKPQIGILFPFALLTARRWRAMLSAAATGLGFAAAAAIAFGYSGWPSFLHALFDRGPDLSPDARIPVWLVSTFGVLQAAGAGTRLPWVAQSVVAAAVGMAVCAVWSRPTPEPLKAAALCIGAVIVTPFLHSLDLCVLPIAGVFIVKDALSRGFLAGERTILILCWLGLLLLVTPAQAIVSLALCFALLALVLRRVIALPATAIDRGGSPEPGLRPRIKAMATARTKP